MSNDGIIYPPTAGRHHANAASAHSSPSPVIILCYGFCGIREILLPAFAKAFTQAGYGIFSFVYERPFVKLK